MFELLTVLDTINKVNGMQISCTQLKTTSGYDLNDRYLVTHNDIVVTQIRIVLRENSMILIFSDRGIIFDYTIKVSDVEYEELLKMSEEKAGVMFYHVLSTYIMTNLLAITDKRDTAITRSALQRIKKLDFDTDVGNITYKTIPVDDQQVNINIASELIPDANFDISIARAGNIVIDVGGQNVNYFNVNIADKYFKPSTELHADILTQSATIISSFFLILNRF